MGPPAAAAEPLLLGIGLPLGILSAAAALWGRYRDLPGFLTGPTICRTEGKGCAVLFRTPRAALLGIPNAALALAFYAFLAAGLAAGGPPGLLLAGALAALATSVFLAASLLSRRLECRICWAGHAANALIAIGMLLRTLDG